MTFAVHFGREYPQLPPFTPVSRIPVLQQMILLPLSVGLARSLGATLRARNIVGRGYPT